MAKELGIYGSSEWFSQKHPIHEGARRKKMIIRIILCAVSEIQSEFNIHLRDLNQGN